MQTMHSKQSKREFRAPPGYGVLKETHQVEAQSEQGLEGGTLFVHGYERGGKVANLVLRGAGQTLQYAFVWQVENGRMSAQGSQLLFQTRPNRKKGESWESEEFLARRVDIYRGKQGLFAITPVGLVSLRAARPVREATARGGFNADAFKAAVTKDRRAFEARKAAAPAQPMANEPSDELVDAVVQSVKQNEGTKGARWDDAVGAVQARVLPEGQAKPTDQQVQAAIEEAMERGLVYEPTLGVLKAT